jgi:hypothetical protein
MRGRYPIKLQRTDSPTSTLSSRRPYSRQDNRGNIVKTNEKTKEKKQKKKNKRKEMMTDRVLVLSLLIESN